MVTKRDSFVRGIVVGCLVMVAAGAMYWMFTPAAHPGAGAFRRWLVVVQGVVGIVGALWLLHGSRTVTAPALSAVASPAAVDAILDTATVVRDYQVRYKQPIRLHVGDEVHLAREDDTYPGWWWCTGGDGECGWVPADRLAPNVSGPFTPGEHARAQDDYDSTELAVERGQVVLIREKDLNWLLVGNGTGAEGWIPASHVNRVRDRFN
jgi:hypothetical protein